MSITDRIVRDAFAELIANHADAGMDEVLDHLAWDVAGAASGLVRPAKWVGAALVRTGICCNPSEAHARMARLVAWQADRASTNEGSGAGVRGDGAVSEVQRIPVDPSVSRLEAAMADATLTIQARLESCEIEELDKAAETMLNLALENGSTADVEAVTISLLTFSDEWGGVRWGTTGRPDATIQKRSRI